MIVLSDSHGQSPARGHCFRLGRWLQVDVLKAMMLQQDELKRQFAKLEVAIDSMKAECGSPNSLNKKPISRSKAANIWEH